LLFKFETDRRYSGEVPLAFIVPSALAKQELARNKADEARIRVEIQRIHSTGAFEMIWLEARPQIPSQHVADHKVIIKERWLTGGVRFIDAVPKVKSFGRAACQN
jgi:hypothetical protein